MARRDNPVAHDVDRNKDNLHEVQIQLEQKIDRLSTNLQMFVIEIRRELLALKSNHTKNAITHTNNYWRTHDK